MDSAEKSEMLPTPRLFNDLYFGPPQPALFETWSLFSRLPVDLRVQIWLAVIRRHRMLEITICAADDEAHGSTHSGRPDSQYYFERNHLGNLISGRSYTVKIAGRDYAATFSPIMWVNRESRDVALRQYYRVHLPFPDQHAGKTLYLNPEHDVIYLFPESEARMRTPPDDLPRREVSPFALLSLADFLHDVKAFDPKDQGLMHVALPKYMDTRIERLLEPTRMGKAPLSPALLHPVAAASFAHILRRSLRSVLCPVRFRHNRRGMGEFTVERYHFAQTFPLSRRGAPTGAFLWFESDPRPGLEFDLRQVTPEEEIPPLVEAWKELEKAFGIEKRSPDDRFRVYICPSLEWPKQGMQLRRYEEDASSENWRRELALHLRQEAEAWDNTRRDLDLWMEALPLGPLPLTPTPRHGTLVSTDMFEMMERTPCTAIALWLFPIEAFDEPGRSGRGFNLSAKPPPSLFLFEV